MNNVEIVVGSFGQEVDACVAFEGSRDRGHDEASVRALLASTITGHEEQRRHLAHELDDETAQTLTSLLLGLRAVEGTKDLSSARLAVGILRASVMTALRGVERIAGSLEGR